VITKSSELFYKWIRYVKRQNTTNVALDRTSNDGSVNKVRNSGRLRKTFSSPPILTNIKKRIIVSSNEDTSCMKDCSFNITSTSQLGSDTDVRSIVEDILDIILFEVVEVIDRKEHMEAVENLVEKMFQRANLTLMEEVSNLHEMMENTSEVQQKNIDEVHSKISQMENSHNLCREDFSVLEQSVAALSTKHDQSLAEIENFKVSINKDREDIKSLKIKAAEYEEGFKNMEVLRIDVSNSKRKFVEDHNTLGLELGQVRKKQKVHEAQFADIEREVILMKNQIRETKENAPIQGLKNEIIQLRTQIEQVEARLTVKVEKSVPASPVFTPKCPQPQFFSPPTPSSCKGSGKTMQEDQNEAMVIFLNRANIKEIATLPAIGNKTAQLIHNHREMRGKFTSLMQIRNIPGINQTVFNKFLMQNQLTLY